MFSAISAAIGALKGPLHGGANEGVIHMLQEIGSLDKVDGWVEDALAQKKKIMGIGHRVYKVLDPRAPHLREMAIQLTSQLGETKWIDMSERIAQIMRDWLRVVELAPLSLTFALADGYPGDPAPEIRDALLRATGERWQVQRADSGGQPSLRELAEASKAADDAAMRASPLVAAALAAFPEAEFVEEQAAGQQGQRQRSRYA